ncbi:hypothetical protein [Vampirovibrio sp.]|uniref:hypothetical protein n=1 Tax=Vampirovibrio sp. TaxID=2717857 RepID=UPI003593796C
MPEWQMFKKKLIISLTYFLLLPVYLLSLFASFLLYPHMHGVFLLSTKPYEVVAPKILFLGFAFSVYLCAQVFYQKLLKQKEVVALGYDIFVVAFICLILQIQAIVSFLF